MMLEVTLSTPELVRLRRPVLGSGGYQSLLRRLQRGLRGRTLRIDVDDLGRLVTFWMHPHRGGFQQRFPRAALARYLRTTAPLFRECEPATPPVVTRWIYLVQDLRYRIKIGVTANRARRGGGRRTDNADPLTVLLWIPETETVTERSLHQRFAYLRVHDTQEWFWPGEELLAFIEAMRA